MPKPELPLLLIALTNSVNDFLEYLYSQVQQGISLLMNYLFFTAFLDMTICGEFQAFLKPSKKTLYSE